MTDQTLYELLGVSPTATKAQIRAAYRLRSKKMHPDGGGDEEAFAKLKLAHDVLIDPKRREIYDRTGKYEDAEPDNPNTAPFGLIMQALDAVYQAIGQTGRPLTQFDLAEALRAKLRDMIANKAKAIETLTGGVRELDQIISRWTVPAGSRTASIRPQPDAEAEMKERPLSSREKEIISAWAQADAKTIIIDAGQTAQAFAAHMDYVFNAHLETFRLIRWQKQGFGRA